MNIVKTTLINTSRSITSAIFLLALFNQAEAIASTDDLLFTTQGQSLFRGKDVDEKSFTVNLFEPYNSKGIEGEIKQVTQEVPLPTLQRAWQNAIDTCTDYVYDLPSPLPDVSPSKSECITGQVKRTYCVNALLKVRLSSTYNSCKFGEAKHNINKDLGVGIGEEPTQPANRNYDVGAILTYESDIKLGFEGKFKLDPGSVDVSFGAKATLTLNKTAADSGETIQLTSSYQLTDNYHLTSRYPNLDFSLGTFAGAKIDVDLEYAGVDYDSGEQVRKTIAVYHADSLNSEIGILDVDGLVRFADTEWLGLNLSPSGVEFRVAEHNATLFGNQLYSTELVMPGILPGSPVSLSFGDLAILTPSLNTPVETDFYCGICEPLTEFIDANNTIHNTTPVGTRELLGGVTDGNTFALPFTNNGIHDTDLFRLDWDVDFMTSLMGTPLGIIVTGPKVFNIKGHKLITSYQIEGNAIDYDVASFWSMQQHLSFAPNLKVTLNFNQAVSVKTETMDNFEVMTQIKMPVGDTIDIIQPASDLKITPVYTLNENEFINDSQLVLTPAIQEKFLNLKFSGLYPDIASAALGFPLDFVALSLTPQLSDPILISQFDKTPVSLDGFVDITGQPLSVTFDPTGSGNGNGNNDQNSESSGGGSLGVFMLILLVSLKRFIRFQLKVKPCFENHFKTSLQLIKNS
ncbi:hypothetical protein [Aliikangiella sp. IMCC44359]|uniref:hypothetical protein n=1 Tax=Aliikangiella sp. IMCC44359 TaxID=3459125 RepID=UPI00403A91E9